MDRSEQLIDILTRLEDRGALPHETSIEHLAAEETWLGGQLAEDPQLAIDLQRALAALRSVDCLLGRGEDAANAPAIPGYEIQGELGAGGMGTVYKAQQIGLKRTVAIKVMWKRGLRLCQRDQRFRTEAELVARLAHPNIVPVFETGETPAANYLVLEYMADGSLADHLGGRPQAERFSAQSMHTIAEAVAYAHQRGVIHRDLKPSNILLSAGKVLKIGDFGLARMLGGEAKLTASGEAVGTPSYMAPEQTRGISSEQSDIYALGAILYQLLTGRPPFTGETGAETLIQVQTQDPVPPRQTRAAVSRDLEAICLKCMEKEPHRRYESAGQVAEDLGRFLAGLPTKARPISGARRLALTASRHRRVTALLGVIAVLLVSLATVSTVAAVRIARSRDEAREVADSERAAREETHRALQAEQQSLADAQAAQQHALLQESAAKEQAETAARVSDFLANLLTTADPVPLETLGFQHDSEIGRNLTVEEVLNRGAKQVQTSLRSQPAARAKLLETLGRVYANLGLTEKAAPLIQEAYDYHAANPQDQVSQASILMTMAMLMRTQGRYQEAELTFHKSLTMQQRLHGADSLEAAEVEFLLALTTIEANQFASQNTIDRRTEVVRMLRHVLEVRQRLLEPAHREISATVMALALVHFGDGNRAEAFRLFLQLGTLLAKQGETSLLTVIGRTALAHECRKRGLHREAERYYNAAIALADETFGACHIVPILIRADKLGMFRTAGRMDDFIVYGHEVINLCQKAVPAGHPIILSGIDDWLPLFAALGDYDEALKVLRYRLFAEERIYGPHWVRTEDMSIPIAKVRFEKGDIDVAEQTVSAWEEKLKEYDKYSGNVAVEEVFYLRGRILEERGDLAEAEKAYRHAYRMTPPTHKADLLPVRLAVVIHRQRPEDGEAEDVLSYYADWKNWHRQQPQKAIYTATLAEIYLDRGKIQEAGEILAATHDFVHQNVATGSYYIGVTDSVCGLHRAAIGEFAEAEHLLLAGLDNLQKSRGSHHQLTRDAADRLARFYGSRGNTAEALKYAALAQRKE